MKRSCDNGAQNKELASLNSGWLVQGRLVQAGYAFHFVQYITKKPTASFDLQNEMHNEKAYRFIRFVKQSRNRPLKR